MKIIPKIVPHGKTLDHYGYNSYCLPSFIYRYVDINLDFQKKKKKDLDSWLNFPLKYIYIYTHTKKGEKKRKISMTKDGTN